MKQYSNNRALNGAYRKGREAFAAGKHERDCPYKDRRNYRGMITWSRAFIIAWLDGYRDAQAERDNYHAIPPT